jgi:PAS domain S-box-containing protein
MTRLEPMGSGPLSAETLRAIVEGASDGMFVTDAEFRIEWVNAAGCGLLGRELADVVGQRISDLMWDPDDLKRAPLRREDLLAGRHTITTRTFRTSQNTPRVLEVSAKLIGNGRLLGIARDATDRLAGEERLRQSETSFRMLIERSPFAVLVHRKGKIVYANNECARTLGWADAQEGIGKPAIELAHVDDRPRVAERIRALQAGEPVVPFTEERVRRADGTYFPASVGAMSVEFEGEHAIVVLARDITEQRRVEDQLARADRLSSLGTLAAGVAHEINNPLTYVLLHLDAIRAAIGRGDNARIMEHAESAAEGAQRVARIVRDLSVFSRSEQDVRHDTDVRKPIGVAISTASHELKHRARVVQDLAEVPPILASEGRVAQIVLNLLLNAAHAIPEGHPDSNEIRVTTRTVDGEVQIAVRDTGCGIPEEHRKRLFEPFFTTKPVGEGSGLGLAICHGLVAALGGRIEVESEVGRGTTFTIVIPAAESSTEPRIERPRTERRAGRARVLFVDDEPAIGAAVSRALEGRHDIVSESSGRAACALLEKDDDFDAVVCDVVMPEMTGAELHQWILRNRPALGDRVIFVSGGRGNEVRRALGDIPLARWLDKPFTLEALESAIAEAMLPAR